MPKTSCGQLTSFSFFPLPEPPPYASGTDIVSLLYCIMTPGQSLTLVFRAAGSADPLFAFAIVVYWERSVLWWCVSAVSVDWGETERRGEAEEDALFFEERERARGRGMINKQSARMDKGGGESYEDTSRGAMMS